MYDFVQMRGVRILPILQDTEHGVGMIAQNQILACVGAANIFA